MKTVAFKPVKPLNPRSADTNVMGMEPTWKTQPTEYRISSLTKAFTWYNYFYSKKDARDMIVNYLESHDRKTDVKLLKGIPDGAVRLTTGWLCRMSMVGLELSEKEEFSLQSQLREILDSKQSDIVDETVVTDDAPRVTIQDRLREKVSECLGEMDGLFDEFVISGAKLNADYKPVVLMRSLNIAPQLVFVIKDTWTKKLAEFEEAVEGKDPDVVKAYEFLTKTQLKACVKFCELVISDCGSYVQIKKVERKPRKVKAVPPEKKAAKFKIQATFPELKLASLSAAQLVDKSEAWLYDSKKRKLIHLVADEYAKVFTIKNNTIIGFSTVETVQKTLRKPAEQLKAITGVGKPAARKTFKDIKATEVAWNPRGSENLIILRVW
jgi:hypothetical protein